MCGRGGKKLRVGEGGEVILNGIARGCGMIKRGREREIGCNSLFMAIVLFVLTNTVEKQKLTRKYLNSIFCSVVVEKIRGSKYAIHAYL